MSKHTPGPWIKDSRLKTAINAGFKHVAMVSMYQSKDDRQNVCGDEHEANANLIAAAPDMLAAPARASKGVAPGKKVMVVTLEYPADKEKIILSTLAGFDSMGINVTREKDAA